MNNFKELTDFLDKYLVSYIIHSDCVEVENDLSLNHNNLTSLPESFGNLKIGGGLGLGYNKLVSLPESFGNLKIGDSLWLQGNNLKSLPDSFGNLEIGGEFKLDWSKLQHSLPDSLFTSGLYKKALDKKLDELHAIFLKRKEQEEMIRFKSQIWVI